MSDTPDQIRADIERTRTELSGDVDALADKVTPSKIMERQTDKVKNAFSSARERIMGAADDAGSSLQGAGSATAGALSDSGRRVAAKAEGNPIAVGLIAFGVGLLAASLLPTTPREKDVATTVKDQAQPLVDTVTEAAKEMGEHLQEPAQEAAASLKDTVSEAVSNVTSEAETAKDDVVGRTQEARQNIADS